MEAKISIKNSLLLIEYKTSNRKNAVIKSFFLMDEEDIYKLKKLVLEVDAKEEKVTKDIEKMLKKLRAKDRLAKRSKS